jgi:cobalt-zinc-cadmium efflux system outer membrane protein
MNDFESKALSLRERAERRAKRERSGEGSRDGCLPHLPSPGATRPPSPGGRWLLLPLLLILVFAASGYTQDLTLERVVSTYIEKNLEVQAARYRLERTKADQIAARLRPNPGFAITAENFAFSGPVPFNKLYEVAATYSETVELGGKRQLRERVADRTVSVAEAQFADALRRGVANVKRLYYDAVLARFNVETARENSQTFSQLAQLNQTRFEEGAIPEADLIKVRLERMKLDSAVRQAELSYRQAVIRLQERLGETAFARQAVAGDLDVAPVIPTLDSLRQIALMERPDIQASAREIDATNERLALEHARARPDLNPFVGYKRLASDNTVQFGVSVPLRIRDRNQAGIARAETDIKTAETQQKLAHNRALAEVEAAYEAFQSARQQVQTFRNEILGQADESRNISLAAYEEGGTDLLPVLEAQRTRSEVRQQYFRTLFEYRSSLIDLELAVGREIQP